MISKELIDYIKISRKRRIPDSEISNTLIEKGWDQKDVIEAMFKYTKPKRELKPASVLAIILIVVVVGMITWGCIFMINDIQKTGAEIAAMTNEIHRTEQGAANLKTYKNTTLGFEVNYPSDVFTLDSANNALKHTLSKFHKYSLKDGADLGLAEDIKIVFKKDIDECDNADNTIEELGEPFVSRGLRGLKYEMGAEGEGVVLYCFRNDAGENIFMIAKYFLNEAWSTELPKQADYLTSSRQEELFNQILNTFKLL